MQPAGGCLLHAVYLPVTSSLLNAASYMSGSQQQGKQAAAGAAEFLATTYYHTFDGHRSLSDSILENNKAKAAAGATEV